MQISVNQHTSAEAPIEKKHYKTEIHQKFVYAFADIQNPKQRPNIQFFLSHHFSTEVRIEKMIYKTEVHRTYVYASAEI